MAFLTLQMDSQILRRWMPVNVLFPENAPDPVPVLYLLHGVHGCYGDWVRNTRICKLAETAGVCVVMPDGGNDFYADNPAAGRCTGRYLTEELVGFIERTFRVSRERSDRFLAGLSMGGFGAVTNGLRHPEMYGGIGGFSSALIKDRILSSTDPKGEEDLFSRSTYRSIFGFEKVEDFISSPNDYDFLADSAAKNGNLPPLYLSCGTLDGLYPANIAFRDRLKALGAQLTWEEWEDGHTWPFWDLSAERFFTWMQSVRG